MLKIDIRTSPGHYAYSVPFGVGNVIALQSGITDLIQKYGSVGLTFFTSSDPDRGSVHWIAERNYSDVRICLTQDNRPPIDTLPELDLSQLGVFIDDLLEHARRGNEFYVEVPIPVLDRRGLFAIVDEWWPSLESKADGIPPETSIRRFSTDRDDLDFELRCDDDQRERDDEFFNEINGDLSLREPDVHGYRIAEFYGPLLPESAAEPAIRSAA